MAALLRFGRLGSFKVDSQGTLLRHPVIWLCSEAKEPGQAIKHLKGPHKAGEDERAAVRACKTAVAFPVKFSGPGALPPFLAVSTKPISSTSEIAAASVTVASKSFGAKSDSLAVPASVCPPQSQEDVSQIPDDEAPLVFAPNAETSIKASGKGSPPIDFPVTIGNVVKAAMVSSNHRDLAIEELSSESSSDSESDSDYECNGEDKKLEVENVARTYSSLLNSPSHQKKGQDEELIVNGLTITIAEAEATQFIEGASKDISQDSGFEILAATRGAAELTGSKFLIDAAPIITQHNTEYETPPLVETQNESQEKAQPNTPVKEVDGFTAPADGLGDAVEESSENASIGPVESEIVSAAVAGNPPAEDGSTADSVEELVDSTQVVIEAPGEELHAETTAAQPEESGAAPPVTEEPFDNSTYKNYQHHSYTNYTFADLDVEMAKHRLPQPSSGKSSPRH